MNKFYFVVGLIWMAVSILWFHTATIWASMDHIGITAASIGVGVFNLGVGGAYVWLARRKDGNDEDQAQRTEAAEDQGRQSSSAQD